MRPRPCSPGGYERRSIAHFSVRQRSPLRKSFMPSRRHSLQLGPVYLAISCAFSSSGRTPLWACGVTSRTPRISSPAAWSERIAVSRPEPGPLTKTSTFCRPCSMPLRAAASAVTCAANGVDLREPLKPAEPADSQTMTLPSLSVSATIVLLKDDLMCAWPMAMFFLTRRRPRPFAAFLGGAITSPSSCGRRSWPGPCACARSSSSAGRSPEGRAGGESPDTRRSPGAA